jgi:molybdopterin/thiamine biosynthesis adenylyltransferase
VALYLGTAGVGRITWSTTTRWTSPTCSGRSPHLSRVGQPKAESARERAPPSTPTCRCVPWCSAPTPPAGRAGAEADVVLDCCDNFATRHAVNAACVKHRVPLVSGAAIGFDGQISVYDTRQADAPCYACLFPPDATFEETRCATMGVFAPLVGIIGRCRPPRR